MQTILPTLIITRPAETGTRFASKVQAGIDGALPVIQSPGLKIFPCDVAVPQNVAHVVFTSRNGVAQVKRLGFPTTIEAWCVGEATAQAAKEIGFQTQVGGGDASQLLDLMLSARPEGQIVHIVGKHTRVDIARTLQQAGLSCVAVEAYDQQVNPMTDMARAALSGDKTVVVPLFSARSGLTLLGTEWRANVHIVAMSEHVAQVAADWGADTVNVVSIPQEDAMVALTCATIDRLKLGLPMA